MKKLRRQRRQRLPRTPGALVGKQLRQLLFRSAEKKEMENQQLKAGRRKNAKAKDELSFQIFSSVFAYGLFVPFCWSPTAECFGSQAQRCGAGGSA